VTRRPPRAAAPAEALVLCAIASVQCGAALATRLFDRVGPAGAVLLRLFFAAVVLVVVTRPRLRGHERRAIVLVLVFGVALAAMNLTFYLAIARIPLGVGVTVEFVGPLAVALAGSRRWLDALWAAFAAAGVGLLTSGGGDIAATGVLLALAAGACWAAYILLSQAVGRAHPGASGLALALVVGAVIAAPPGIARGGRELLSPLVLLTAFGVAMLSSAIPYSLELAALRRLPTRVFGVLMSLEPGMAALAGWIVIGQTLRSRSIVALVLVSTASLGSALAHRRGGRPETAAPVEPGAERAPDPERARIGP
jgi:inner membrane transporter RhtA